MAEKVGVSRKTISAVESGNPHVSFGTLLKVTWIMGLEDRLISSFAQEDDPVALPEARMSLSRRIRQRNPACVTGSLDF